MADNTLNDVSQGASLGASLGSVIPGAGTLTGGLIGAGLGLGLGGIKYLMGSAQRKQANSIHPINPGYQMNNEVLDNARITGDVYGNYQLPGYSKLLTDLNGSYADSFTKAQQGATSSADLLTAANTGNQVHNDQLDKLAVVNAQGKQSALTQYLAAKAAAGQEQQNKNEYDRNEYEKQLDLKNRLNNNATANQYGAADQAGKLISSIFSYRGANPTPGPQGAVKTLAPIFDGTNAANFL